MHSSEFVSLDLDRGKQIERMQIPNQKEAYEAFSLIQR